LCKINGDGDGHVVMGGAGREGEQHQVINMCSASEHNTNPPKPG
jgi:hypothetical protein